LQGFLEEAIVEMAGIIGLARARPSVIHLGQSLAIVRVDREGLDTLRAALAMSRKNCVKIVRVTGTLKKARSILSQLEEHAEGCASTLE